MQTPNLSQKALKSVRHTTPSVLRPSVCISKSSTKNSFLGNKDRNLRKSNRGGMLFPGQTDINGRVLSSTKKISEDAMPHNCVFNVS